MGDVDDFVEAVENEALGYFVDDSPECFGGEGQGSDPFVHLSHVMGRVADGDQGGVKDIGLFRSPFHNGYRGEAVCSERNVSTVFFAASYRNQDHIGLL